MSIVVVNRTAWLLLSRASAESLGVPRRFLRFHRAAGVTTLILGLLELVTWKLLAKEDPLSLNDCFKVQHVAFLGNRQP